MRAILLQRQEKYDISAAQEYGEIKYITEDYLDPFWPDKIVNLVRQRLDQMNFNKNKDMICLTGPSILVAQFLATTVYHYHKVKVLLFDAKNNKYRLRTINLRGE